jgi:hypothetical protein
MKTTTINTHSIAPAIAGSSQRGAREYQRKPGYYQLVQRQPAVTVAVPQGPSFREILERELSGGIQAEQVAKAAGSADAETTQFLTGYWA